MSIGGWVKIYTKVTNWEWYSNPNTFCVWMHLLIEVNHEPKMWQGLLIQAGQIVTSLASLSATTGLSVRQVRTALKNLQATNNVTIQATNKFSIITLCKYGIYNEWKNTKRQAERQAESQSNDNNLSIIDDISSKDNNRKVPTILEVKEYCESRNNGIDAEQFISYYESRGWKSGKSVIVDWKAAVRTWERNNKHYRNGTDSRRGTEVPTTPNYAKGF